MKSFFHTLQSICLLYPVPPNQLILTAGDRFHSRVTLILTLRSVRILRYRLFYFIGLVVSRISAAVLGYKNNNYNLCPSLPVT